ncbi:MAG: hypothetical protein WC851_03390 [Candidatus Shapirobacteria bacterium]|jgi:hypothetical protein
MKNIIIVLIFLSIVGGGYWFYQSSQPITKNVVSGNTTPVSPSRMAEINGYVISIAGNEVVVANEIGLKEVTEEERLRRQKLTQEERQALKAAESANVSKENVTVVIPVGIALVKGSGDASGKNLPADLSEIKKGIYLSVWKTGEEIEFVKLKGTVQ